MSFLTFIVVQQSQQPNFTVFPSQPPAHSPNSPNFGQYYNTDPHWNIIILLQYYYNIIYNINININIIIILYILYIININIIIILI